MLRIDCLLKDTDIAEDVKTYMQYLGASKAEKGMDASLPAIYNELRKNGIEVDLSSASKIYADVLSIQNHPSFTQRQDVEKISGQYFDNIARNLLLQEKTGEKQISELSPSQAVAKRLAAAFTNTVVQDTTTKSILRTMQDAYMQQAKRLVGDLPKTGEKDTRSFEEVIQQAIDKESMGYVNNATSAVNGFAELHKGAQEIMRRLTNEINNSKDPILKEQWDNYAKSFEESVHSLIFSTTEGKKVLTNALMSAEGGGFVKTLKDGSKLPDWKKLANNSNSITQLRENVTKAITATGFTPEIANKVANSLEKEFNELHGKIIQYGTNVLDRRQEGLSEDKVPVQTSELTRLAELNNYGIFDGAHDDLLHHLLGVDATDQETRKGLKEVMQKKAQLMQMVNGHEFLAYSLNSELQRQVTNLIEKNIADKTKVGAIARTMLNYQHLVNMGIIGNAFNMTENNISGLKESISATTNIISQQGLKQGLKVFYETNRLFLSTLKDVGKGGAEYGLDNGRFNQHSSIADKWSLSNLKKEDWKDITKLPKNLATLIVAPAKTFLNGSDAAFKASIHQKTTILNLHKALTDAGMDKNAATEYLNKELFGKSIEDARDQAEYMYKKLGMEYDKNKIERVARNLVYSNVYSGGQIDANVIDAATKGAYHVAALGLGHAAYQYNIIARGFKALQTTSTQHYQKLLDAGKYKDAAWYRMVVDAGMVNGVLKFSHGVANWMLLRPLSAGVGLVVGGIQKGFNKSDLIDYSNKKGLHDAFVKYADSNRQLSRAMVGISYFGLNAAALGLYGALRTKSEDEDQQEGNLASAFHGIKNNPIANKFMNKVGADAALMMYLSYTAKHGDVMAKDYNNMQGALKYVENSMNVGQGYTIGEEIVEASKDLAMGSGKMRMKAMGIMGNLIRNTFIPGGGELPFYNSFKGVYYLSKDAVTGKSELPPFYSSYSLGSGMANTAALHDIDHLFHLGLFTPPLEMLPYVGKDAMATFKFNGVESLKDMKEKYGTGPEADEFIEDVVGRGEKGKRAVKAYHAEIGE